MSTKSSSGFGAAGGSVRRRRIGPGSGALACALAAFAIAVPVAAAADGTDLRSPDTDEAAATAGSPTTATDLRSPDTRAAAADLTRTQVVGALQSPDRQDANRPSVEIVQLPAVETVRTVEVSSGMSASAGAGIGVGRSPRCDARRRRAPRGHALEARKGSSDSMSMRSTDRAAGPDRAGASSGAPSTAGRQDEALAAPPRASHADGSARAGRCACALSYTVAYPPPRGRDRK